MYIYIYICTYTSIQKAHESSQVIEKRLLPRTQLALQQPEAACPARIGLPPLLFELGQRAEAFKLRGVLCSSGGLLTSATQENYRGSFQLWV